MIVVQKMNEVTLAYLTCWTKALPPCAHASGTSSNNICYGVEVGKSVMFGYIIYDKIIENRGIRGG